MPRFANLADRDPEMVRLAQQVAAKVVGYAHVSPESVLESMEDARGAENDYSFLDEFDRLVFCCTVCEYWFSQTDNAHPGYDHTNPWMCRECKREEAA